MNGFNGYNNFGNVNGGFSLSYIPRQMPTNAYSVPSQQPDTFVAWVQGRSGAEAYPLAPGRSALLMDSNAPIIYAKSTDTSGRYLPLKSFKLVPMEDTAQTQALPTEAIDYEKIREIISEEVNRQYKTQRKDGNK